MKKTLDCYGTGILIRNMCEKRGMTAGFIADNLNVSQQTVYSWYSAKKLPTLDHLVELADILNVSMDELVATKGWAG